MKITGLSIGGVEVLEVREVGVEFSHDRTHHTQTATRISVKIKSDIVSGSLSFDRKQAARLVRLLQKALVIRKKPISAATRKRWAKNK